MAIITVSRDAFSHGREVAEKVASELGFEAVGTELVQQAVSEAAQHLGKRPTRKDVALFRSSFYEQMSRDNIVYHGMAGHVFLADIPNVLKVRLVADLEDRVGEEIRRTGDSYEDALRILSREDDVRKQWHQQLFGQDALGPDPYDLSLNLHNLGVDRAARIIVDAASAAMEQDGSALQSILMDLALAAKAEALLLDHFGDAQAEVRGGTAYVRVEASIVQEEAAGARARTVLSALPGIREAHVGIIPSMYVPF
ncbi:MAG: AAA family ATPase [Desulfovibrionaceae bacterium]